MRTLFSWKYLSAGILLIAPFLNSATIPTVQKLPLMQVSLSDWKPFHCVFGKCSVAFPSLPEHVSEKMVLPEEGGVVLYDAYFSQPTKEGVFMMMIAQYPAFVNEDFAQVGLEGFLNGLLNQNPTHRLIFADLILVDGHKALDFFIHCNHTYFKGRAMMIKNNFYLIAMECEIQSYNEGNYNHFINSFKIEK